MLRLPALLVILFTVCLPVIGHAEQPVFDEMPRWSGGYGLQLLQEYRARSFRRANAGRLTDTEQALHFTHIQGVYTWQKSIRLTVKLPVVLQSERRRGTPEGPTESTLDRGLGDPVIAVPLKRYFNLDGRSGSWTLSPQLRLPLGTTHSYDRYGRVWSGALFAGYETETYRYIVGGNVGGWVSAGDQTYALHAHFGGGPNWRYGSYSGHVKLKSDVTAYATDEVVFALAPVFYMRVTDLMHLQVKFKHVVASLRPKNERGRTDSFRLGFGFVY